MSGTARREASPDASVRADLTGGGSYFPFEGPRGRCKMHFATAPCKISGSLPEIFLIEREGRALPPFTLPPAALFLQPFLLFRRVAFYFATRPCSDVRTAAAISRGMGM